MNITYGYITGAFDIDLENDVITEIQRIDDAGNIEYLLSIETNRDIMGLNVIPFNSALEYSQWLIKNGVAE